MGTIDASKRFEIQHSTFFQGWVNTWTDTPVNGDPIPTTFETEKAAQDELNDYLAERVGDESPDDYRIRPVNEKVTNRVSCI